MAGIAILVTTSILAIIFSAVFFVALCRERYRIKICMLLRQDAGDGSNVTRCVRSESDSEGRSHALEAIRVVPIRKTLLFQRKPREATIQRVA